MIMDNTHRRMNKKARKKNYGSQNRLKPIVP